MKSGGLPFLSKHENGTYCSNFSNSKITSKNQSFGSNYTFTDLAQMVCKVPRDIYVEGIVLFSVPNCKLFKILLQITYKMNP